MVDIDFAEIDNLRRIHEKINQEKDFQHYLDTERNDRIMKLAKLP